MMYGILDKINAPEDVKALRPEQLVQLCEELRDYIVRCCAVNPGHLGSSLGAVELIVALHYIYDAPADKLIFDVGHQAYAHKIICGRREAFKGNRTRNGISGFPNRAESPYDAFGTGHSSTSVSAALGFAQAFRMRGEDRKVVALIGDGSLTGGLAFEGLNNVGASKSDVLIVLNDNNMSIDNNTGALHDYLLKVTMDPRYNRLKKMVWDRMGDRSFRKSIQRLVVGAKSSLVRKSGGALFESMGFRYFGPIDGNDISQVIRTLSRLKNIKGPKLLHVITRKGKGYAPAEADPTVWHAPGHFDPETGKRAVKEYAASRYQDVFGQTLVDLAKQDPAVVGVTPAMASGCGMTTLAERMPERFFDVGIEEEHAVTFSAGLAAAGMKPFCNIYSSFSQRAYDQIIHDVALQNLGVVLCLDRAGLVGEDGATHHGCYDMAAYRSIPNAVIAVPSDELVLRNMMYTAKEATGGPFIIRYPRGCGEGTVWKSEPFAEVPVGKAVCLRKGERVALFCAGPFVWRAVEAAERIREEQGWMPEVWDVRYVKPFDADALADACTRCRCIITVEDGCLKGGLCSEISERIASKTGKWHVSGIGIPDVFVTQGTQAELRQESGLDTAGIYRKIRQENEDFCEKNVKSFGD